MKGRTTVLFISLLLALSSMAQEKNPDVFLYSVFTAIKKDDSLSFVKLFINYQQFKSFLVESVLRSKDTLALKSIDSYGEKQYQHDQVKLAEKHFSALRNKMIVKGADPSVLIFDSGRYRERIPTGFDNLREYDGSIYVASDGETCRIPFIATWVQSQQGWLDINLRDFLKNGEELPQRNKSGRGTVTVQLEDVEEMEESPPPPPPSQKKKVTSKSPAKKTKVKT